LNPVDDTHSIALFGGCMERLIVHAHPRKAETNGKLSAGVKYTDVPQGLYSNAPLGIGENGCELNWLYSVDDAVAYAINTLRIRISNPKCRVEVPNTLSQ